MNNQLIYSLCLILLATGCASSPRGMQCQGEVKTLPGQPVALTSAVIVDNIHAFSVIMPDSRIDSGLLYSADRTRYIPSAVTQQGYLAQRLSNNTFCIIDPAKNQYTTYHCQ